VGNDLIKGTTYVDGGTLNAANLNAHVDDAALKYTCINSRTLKDPIGLADEFLINDSGTLKKVTYDTMVLPGTVIQSTYGTYTANADLTNIIPQDDTIPQISEGTQIISVSFTPRFADSQMVLRFSGTVSTSNANNVIAAIFRDSGTNAIAGVMAYLATVAAPSMIDILATDLPATVSTITYTVRAGPGIAGTLRFNGGSGGRYLGGVAVTTLEVQEVKV
jgi:hypothetical protein